MNRSHLSPTAAIIPRLGRLLAGQGPHAHREMLRGDEKKKKTMESVFLLCLNEVLCHCFHLKRKYSLTQNTS